MSPFSEQFFLKSKSLLVSFISAFFLAASSPALLSACACGCGVFDVGTGAMLPTHEGGMAYLEYDDMDQNQNFHGSSKAPADDNEDKRLRSRFVTAGAQYMFNRRWGAMLDVPVTDRHFETEDEDGNNVSFDHTALADIRLRGIYSGFSADLSTGLTFGVKFPSGDYKYDHFDRDTQIGSGSTNLLLGAFHRGALTSDNRWSWFVNGQADAPVLITPAYRPGTEADGVLGLYYNAWDVRGVKIAPVAQALGSLRGKDTGADADPANTGYNRLLLSPGLELSADGWRLYGDIEFPVHEWVRGDQIVANKYIKVNVSRTF